MCFSNGGASVDPARFILAGIWRGGVKLQLS
jgi:hypothetical protein